MKINWWEYIIIHHSLTKDQAVVDWPAIRRYHVDTLGWSDIGYHFGIEFVERAAFDGGYEILIGRQLNEIGAHCKEMGMNKYGIGVCMIGNCDFASPPLEQMDKLTKLTKALMDTFNIPRENVMRHHDFAPYKTCPGIMFPWGEFKSSL